MRWLGHKSVALKSIRMDVADIRQRMKADHVVAIAQSLTIYGGELMQAPTVRAGSMTLVAGRDRCAALKVFGAKKLTVHVVECTDAEAAELEIVENAHRRGEDRTALLARLADLREAALTEEAKAASSSPLQAASIQTIRGVARKQAAQIAGVSPARVKQAQAAAKKDSAPASGHGAQGEPATGSPPVPLKHPDAAPEPLPPPTIDVLGTPWERDSPAHVTAEACAEAQDKIDAVDKLLRQAQALLKTVPDFPEGLRQELYADVHRVADRVRAARPASLCPWCKGLARQVPRCPGCNGGFRWVTAEVAARAPREVLEFATFANGARRVAVCVNGEFYPYADVAAHPGEWKGAPQAKAKNGRRITIEMPDGEPFEPSEAGPYSDDDDGTPIAFDDEDAA